MYGFKDLQLHYPLECLKLDCPIHLRTSMLRKHTRVVTYGCLWKHGKKVNYRDRMSNLQMLTELWAP